MKKIKANLKDFLGSSLNTNQLKYVIGGIETVPPQGDPGDIKETTYFTKPKPETGTTNPYLDPTADDTGLFHP